MFAVSRALHTPPKSWPKSRVGKLQAVPVHKDALRDLFENSKVSVAVLGLALGPVGVLQGARDHVLVGAGLHRTILGFHGLRFPADTRAPWSIVN